MGKRETDIYNIGSNIRIARKRANMTQEELSERVGITPQYLSDIERGLVGPSVTTLKKICTNLNISSDFILFGENQDADGASLTLFEKLQRLPKHKTDLVLRSMDILMEAMELDLHQLDKGDS